MIVLEAHAKLNLTLEVLGKRDDGYHETASIMQTLDLVDTVTLEPSDGLELSCSCAEIEGEDNLALKAARLLREESGTSLGAAIHITKRIPVASGLGGGSADAAATLVGLNRMWDLDLSNDDLRHVASKLGSDVPLLVEGGTAIALGRGERIRSLPPPDLPWFVLAFPISNLTDKTTSMYRALTPDRFTRGALTHKLEARIRSGGDVPPQLLFNVFDDVARRINPDVDRCWNDFHAAGAREIHVSGSGPTVYTVLARKEMATTVALVMEKIKRWKSVVTRAWPQSQHEQ